MIFPAPIFLYLLPLAGLPVVFHFILRQKKRTVVFPTLMFFYRTDPKLNSHRKIRQWLLLLMRILFIAFILLVLSRPKFVTSAGLGGDVPVVAIVDNSGSMSAAADYGDRDNTRLECAVEGARKLVSTLEGTCEAAVLLLVDDSALEVSDSLTSDRESLLACLDKVRATEATGNAYRALRRAFELLESSSTGGGAVHVFSDLQQAEWAKDTERIEAGDTSIMIYLHKIQPKVRNEANVAITATQFPQERILPKHPYKVGLILQNNSDIAADIRLNSIDSQNRKNTENVTLAGGKTRTVELEVKLDNAGYYWLKTWIEGDGFSADNEAGIGIFCEQTAVVLFAGKPEEFGVLPVALSPSGQGQFTGMVVEFSQQPKLNETIAEKNPILVITTWNGVQSVGENSLWLQQYVEKGGNILIVPSAKSMQRFSANQLPDWLGAGIRQREVYPRGVKLEMLDSATSFRRRIREATSGSQLEPVGVYALYPLELTAEFAPLFKIGPAADRDEAVIAHRKLGEGNIYVSGIAFTSHWSTLPSTGLLVVMAQQMAISGTSLQEEQGLLLVAGDYPHVNAQGEQVEVLSLVGDAINWKGKESEIPAFPKAGVYVVTTKNNKYCVSVRASEQEGFEEFIEGEEIPAMSRITHEILPYDEQENFGQYHKGQAKAINVYLPLLLLATLVLLVEGWLGAPSSLARPPSLLFRAGNREEITGTYSRRVG